MSKPVLAIVGRPNVGKSTLFNKLIGERRAIVEDIPGITRDRIYGETEWRGRKFIVIDTGGIEPKTDDIILRKMKEQAQIAIDTADVILFMCDIRSGLVADDRDIAVMLKKSGKPVVPCINKSDKIGDVDAGFYEFYELGFSIDPIPLSSIHGSGSGDVLDAACEALGEWEDSEDDGDVINVAVIGKPNAGKSSLLNALLGYERAIVTDVPGTTRDTIEEKLRVGGVLLRLTDTAGIRDTGDAVERLGVERSLCAMEAAELVFAVVDGSRPVDDEDMRIIHAAERAPHALLVVSKRDIAQGEVSVDAAMPRVYVSALTGEGLDELQAAVRDMFPLPAVPAGEILTNARQADAVSRALDYITAALDAMNVGATPDIVLTEAEGAMQALGELSGRSVREDVTDRIFSRFCVGK